MRYLGWVCESRGNRNIKAHYFYHTELGAYFVCYPSKMRFYTKNGGAQPFVPTKKDGYWTVDFKFVTVEKNNLVVYQNKDRRFEYHLPNCEQANFLNSEIDISQRVSRDEMIRTI